MKRIHAGASGAQTPIALTDEGRPPDRRPLTPRIDGSFLAGGGIDRAREAAAAGTLPETDIAGLHIGSPIAAPRVILCVGMNYAAHARESGVEPPAPPIIFYKAPNTLLGPNDAVPLPRGAKKLDWEVELALVIGQRCRYLNAAEAELEYVAGCAVANDVYERAFQLKESGGQWSRGKSAETFNPMAPWLVTVDEIPDPHNLRLRSWGTESRGKTRQPPTRSSRYRT